MMIRHPGGGMPDTTQPSLAGPVPEVDALAELLAEVVVLAGRRALYPGRFAEIADRAQQHPSVRRALRGQR